MIEKSCFNRCTFKFTEALKFTSDFLNYQTYEIKKIDMQMKEQVSEEKGLLDRWHQIYE